MEKYDGAKFKTIFIKNKFLITEKHKELINWFRKFYSIGLAPEYRSGSSGNLSFRHKNGFVIKSTKTYFNKIKADELVFVQKFDLGKKIAYVHGKMFPSTELQMHYLIYKNKKQAKAVFHLHDYKIMEKAEKYGIPVTKVTEAGTEKIGYDVIRCLDGKNFVVMNDHGVVAVSKTMGEAGNTILKYHKLTLRQ